MGSLSSGRTMMEFFKSVFVKPLGHESRIKLRHRCNFPSNIGCANLGKGLNFRAPFLELMVKLEWRRRSIPKVSRSPTITGFQCMTFQTFVLRPNWSLMCLREFQSVAMADWSNIALKVGAKYGTGCRKNLMCHILFLSSLEIFSAQNCRRQSAECRCRCGLGQVMRD